MNHYIDNNINKRRRSYSIHQTNSTIHQGYPQLFKALNQVQNQCIQQGNFKSAQQYKQRKQHLKQQLSKHIQKQYRIENQTNQSIILFEYCQQLDKQKIKWDKQIKQLLINIKNSQKQLLIEQIQQMEYFQKKAQGDIEINNIKYSSIVLDMENKLSRVIQMQNYKLADILKKQLQTKMNQQQKNYLLNMQEKINKQKKKIQNRHKNQLKALRIRMGTILNQKINERNQLIRIMNNKISNIRRKSESKQKKDSKIKMNDSQRQGNLLKSFYRIMDMKQYR